MRNAEERDQKGSKTRLVAVRMEEGTKSTEEGG